MKGKITKIKAWTLGKGCFVGIDNGESDYLYNRLLPNVEIGDIVEYEVGKPTKDGKPTLTSVVLVGTTVEAFVDEDKVRSATLPAKWQDDVDTRRAKLRLDCLRLAIDGGATLTAIEKAREYEKYVRGE